jgi:hypothetical protein
LIVKEILVVNAFFDLPWNDVLMRTTRIGEGAPSPTDEAADSPTFRCIRRVMSVDVKALDDEEYLPADANVLIALTTRDPKGN